MGHRAPSHNGCLRHVGHRRSEAPRHPGQATPCHQPARQYTIQRGPLNARNRRSCWGGVSRSNRGKQRIQRPIHRCSHHWSTAFVSYPQRIFATGWRVARASVLRRDGSGQRSGLRTGRQARRCATMHFQIEAQHYGEPNAVIHPSKCPRPASVSRPHHTRHPPLIVEIVHRAGQDGSIHRLLTSRPPANLPRRRSLEPMARSLIDPR